MGSSAATVSAATRAGSSLGRRAVAAAAPPAASGAPGAARRERPVAAWDPWAARSRCGVPARPGSRPAAGAGAASARLATRALQPARSATPATVLGVAVGRPDRRVSLSGGLDVQTSGSSRPVGSAVHAGDSLPSAAGSVVHTGELDPARAGGRWPAGSAGSVVHGHRRLVAVGRPGQRTRLVMAVVVDRPARGGPVAVRPAVVRTGSDRRRDRSRRRRGDEVANGDRRHRRARRPRWSRCPRWRSTAGWAATTSSGRRRRHAGRPASTTTGAGSSMLIELGRRPVP